MTKPVCQDERSSVYPTPIEATRSEHVDADTTPIEATRSERVDADTTPIEATRSERVGVYPGSFDPPTIAHLAIAVMAKRAADLDRVELVVSRQALAKNGDAHVPFELRIGVIEASTAHAPWLSVVVTDKQLIADIAQGYAVVIMGSDKWHQIHDVAFYPDVAARDRAVASLPPVVGPNRPDSPPLPDHAIALPLPARLLEVSSSGARSGRPEWMTPPARKTAEARGVWGLGA